jgi:hypothetical protein
MPGPNQSRKNPAAIPKLITLPCFVTYRVSCVDTQLEPLDLEISPFAILVAASVINENANVTIEEGLSLAMLNILDSIADQYTITGIRNR